MSVFEIVIASLDAVVFGAILVVLGYRAGYSKGYDRGFLTNNGYNDGKKINVVVKVDRANKIYTND